MSETKKVKHAGRFGSRYGKGIRDRVIEIEKEQRSQHTCPKCEFKRVKRVSTGLFECKKCGHKFAGGAFTPNTMSGNIVKKMVSQRKFLPLAKELIRVREEKERGLKEKKQEEKKTKKKPREKKKKEPKKEKDKEKKKEKETKKEIDVKVKDGK